MSENSFRASSQVSIEMSHEMEIEEPKCCCCIPQAAASVLTWIITGIELVINTWIVWVVIVNGGGSDESGHSLTVERVLAPIDVLLKFAIFYGLVHVCQNSESV